MFPCRFNLSTRQTAELVARRAIKSLEEKEPEDLSPYLDPRSPKYAAMIDWIAKDLNVTTLRYQTIEDLVAAIGLPKERVCVYCWTGECPASTCASEKVSAIGAFRRRSKETRPAAANE
jgi:amidophosphoribosyltransferase